MIEFKDGTLDMNDNGFKPKIEMDFEETISVTNNYSNLFMHKSSKLFGYFIEVHTPKYGMVAIFREIVRPS